MRQERFFNRPLYLQVRDALAERVAAGHCKPGDAIPNEIDLARKWGVSSGTMRKSLDLLESEHLLTRLQGRGTFVKDPGSQDLMLRFSNIYLADGTRIGGEARTLDIAVAEACEPECERLHLIGGDQVYRISRVRSHRSKVFMIEQASLPAALFPLLVEQGLPSHRLVAIAQAYGMLLGKAEERISVGAPSPLAAEALNLAQGTQVLILDRVVRTAEASAC